MHIITDNDQYHCIGYDLQPDLVTVDYRDRLSDGRRAMAHLIHVWHERNGWSHKVLPALAQSLALGRVHNSQISNLRNAKLAAPGPEVFLALAQANAVIFKGLECFRDQLQEKHPELLNVLVESAIPLVRDDGHPITAGDFFEIFIGIASLPSCFDWFIEEDEASGLSAALAEFFCQGRLWRQCREEVMAAYSIQKSLRRERFEAVMAGLRDFTAQELDGELLDLFMTFKYLGGDPSIGPDGFLHDLRIRAKVLGIKQEKK
tara:strand:- start:84 stop:866 length:783 start_codon:yes stop_codon:yes gene_type:complete